MKLILKILLPIIVLAIGIAFFVLLKVTAPISISKTTEEQKWPVNVEKIKLGDARPKIFGFGSIVAGSEIDLRTRVSGKIIKIGSNFSKGGIIKKGDKIARIDPFEYQLEVSNKKATFDEVGAQIRGTKAEIKTEIDLLDISKSQLDLRERNLKRRQKLGKKGSSSRKSTDDAKIAFNKASQATALYQQSIMKLKTKLAELKARQLRAVAALKLANRNLDETEIIAPFSGFLTKIDASEGQYVNSSDRLGHLVKADRMEVRFQLKDSDFSSLFEKTVGIVNKDKLVGKKIEVRWQIGSKRFDYLAVISRLGAEVKRSSGGMTVYAHLLNIKLDTLLRPGAFVEVVIPDRSYKKIWSIPDTALAGSNVIYIIKNNRLVAKEISIIRRIGKEIYIRGDLPKEFLIVANTFPEIAPNLKVDPL